jgi:mono/diheme cytochrome c family protein
LALATTVHADGAAMRVPLLPRYQQECAACHVAYPPGLLPAASWQRIMASLSKHFGTDASLDEAAVREINAWLQQHAGSGRRAVEPPQDRITQSDWFLREHNAREVPPALWKSAAVGRASNCAACHTDAEQGRFSERAIRLPR